jgi:hypothetical protein
VPAVDIGCLKNCKLAEKAYAVAVPGYNNNWIA